MLPGSQACSSEKLWCTERTTVSDDQAWLPLPGQHTCQREICGISRAVEVKQRARASEGQRETSGANSLSRSLLQTSSLQPAPSVTISAGAVGQQGARHSLMEVAEHTRCRASDRWPNQHPGKPSAPALGGGPHVGKWSFVWLLFYFFASENFFLFP